MTALWVASGGRRGTRRGGCGSIRWRVEADDRVGRTNLWEMGVSSSRGSKNVWRVAGVLLLSLGCDKRRGNQVVVGVETLNYGPVGAGRS